MTAAEERRTIATLAGAVLASAGPGRRWPRHRGEVVAARWSDLAAVPDWLCLPADERDRLARNVALVSMAGALAASIDGAWLGALAKVTGETAIDRAIDCAGAVPATDLPSVPAEDLDGRGYAVLAATLSPALRRYLPGDPEPLVEADVAAAWLAAVRAG